MMRSGRNVLLFMSNPTSWMKHSSYLHHSRKIHRSVLCDSLCSSQQRAKEDLASGRKQGFQPLFLRLTLNYGNSTIRIRFRMKRSWLCTLRAIQMWPKEPLLSMLSEITYSRWFRSDEQPRFKELPKSSTNHVLQHLQTISEGSLNRWDHDRTLLHTHIGDGDWKRMVQRHTVIPVCCEVGELL